MPKKSIDFDAPLTVRVPNDLRIRLIAVGYYRGQGGSYAAALRDFLESGVRRFEAGLSPRDRERFGEILENVRTSEAYRDQG